MCRRLFNIVLILLTFVCSYGQQTETGASEFKIYYYADGKKSSEGTLRQGKPDGYWKTYFPNGKVKSEGNRENFVLDSLWKFYNEDGILTLEYYYENGKKTGEKKTYDSKTGKLLSIENFKEDVKQNFSFNYHSNGKIKDKIPFVDGKENGNAFEYDTLGNIITLTEYKLGFTRKSERINRKDRDGLKQGVWKDFYDNGNLKNEGRYLNDKKDGYFKDYALNGSLLKVEKYTNGKLQEDAPELKKVDIFTEYHPTGKLKFTGGYKDGVPEGVHRDYNDSGLIVSSKIYSDGVIIAEGIMDEKGNQQGIWKEYHTNGKIKAQGEYKDAKRVGEWVFYHPNGKVEQKGKYDKKGKAQGLWKWYYESGNLLREENYVNDKLEGNMIEYSDSGKVITKGEYLDGLKEGTWVYEMGDYREEGAYKADKRDGEWKHFYTNGKLRFEGKFIDGSADGKHKYYHSNGKLMQEGKYIMGNKDGEWVFKDATGLLLLTITYVNDIEIKFDGVKVKPTEQEVLSSGTSAEKKSK
ncbi:MAG: toxin-antitoxin system YwqK family antitoxin [Bacteroidetes bacterium]|nr:toxin-antitoxin system YwqK family antitoxin [Bacteroidota bacterium]